MDKYAGLASLFDPSVGSGDAALDELIGLRPYSAREREEDRRRELADIEASMGGGEAGAMGGDGEQNLAYARRYLESRGVPAHIAAGAVGNFAQESGGIAGGALNKEGGLGIAQWRGERLYGGGGYEGLVPFAKRQGRSPQDLTTQLDYFISELQGPERSAFEKAMQTRTPEQAAVALGRYYERPNEQYANYGNRAAQARRFAAIPDEQIQNAPSGMYLDVTGGRPFQQRQAQQSQQPQLETVPMQLSTGQTINVEKGMTHEEVAAMLRKEGIEGAPLRPFQAPNGQTINVEYDMSDDEVLGMLRKEAPEYAVPQGSPAPDKSSYTAAAKEALLQGASGIATGLGGEIGELGKATTGAEFLGQYAKPIGEAITGAGESMRGYGEELGHRAEGVFEMPKDASWFEKNVAYPAVQTGAGIVPYAAAYAIPGVGPATGTAALYGGAMGGLEERAKETGKEFVPSEARPYAVGEAAIDYVGGRLLGPLKKLFSDDVVLGARETIIKAVEKGGIEEAKKVVGSRLGNIAKQVGITDAAFTSSEVAENVIERAYAGQPLFDDAALEEYANTAKQVAGFGGVAGAVQGLGRHHIKATEVARIEEQKATEAAVKAQEEAQQFKQEAANAQAAEVAKRKAERQPIEIPEELQGMPYKDAVRYMQMREAKAAPPVEEAPVEEEIPEPTVQAKPYYEQLGLKARKNSIILNGLKQLNPEDPTHGPAINAFLDEIETKKMPRDQQAIDALRTKLSEVQQNAQQISEAGPTDGSGSAQPGFRKEGGDQAISGAGMESSRQGEQGAEGEAPEKVEPIIKAVTQEVPAKVGVKDAVEMFEPDSIAERKDVGFKSRRKLVNMPIKDFLLLAKEGRELPEKVERIESSLNKGEKLQEVPTLQLFKAPDGQQVVEGHEGRHRAKALLRRGYTHMPVEFLSSNIRWGEQRDPTRFDYIDEWPTTLKGQNGDIVPFPVSREAAGKSYGEAADETAEKIKAVTTEAPAKVEVDGVERPATDSTGAPIHTTADGVKNFWKNFGKTKVIDTVGQPIRVFHLTNADVEAFDKGKLGSNTGAPSAGKGFFFAGKPETTEHYAAQPSTLTSNLPEEADDLWAKYPVSTLFEVDTDYPYKGMGEGNLDYLAEPAHAAEYAPIALKKAQTEFAKATARGENPNFSELLSKARASYALPPLGLNARSLYQRHYLNLENPETGYKRQIAYDIHINKDRTYQLISTDYDYDPDTDAGGGYIPTWNQPDQINKKFSTLEDALNAADKHASKNYGKEIKEQVGLLPNAPNVMPVYLDMKNPLVYDMKGSRYREVTYNDLLIRAKKEGYDGLIIKNTYDGGPLDDIYVAFEPTQIKSAIGNTGAFDTTRPEVKSVSIQNPDLGIVPLPISEFESAIDAKDLLHRYEKIATDSQLHNLAKTYLTSPHAASIKTIFFKRGDKIPDKVQKVFDVEKAGAATVIGEDGVRLYFRTDDPDSFSEDIVIHEVTHAMTEAALARNPAARNELQELSSKIGMVIRSNNPTAGDFWNNIATRDPSETLAYGLTSPTFRQILSKYDENGHRLKTKPAEFTGQMPKQLSLWDKFVDAVAKLFGLPTKRKEQFQRELNEYLNKKTEYERQVSDYNARRPMQAKLDSILQELLATTEKEGVALPSQVAIKQAQKEAPRNERGLAGKLKDKDFGEKLSEATRDILTSGRKTSLRSEWFDQSEALGKATENLPTMVGKKARVDFLASHVAQVGNVIADSIHNGFVKDVGDGSVMTIKDHNLAPEKIFRRVAETGKKELFNEMLVALRGRSIREADKKTKALADDLLTKADEMEEYASTLQDKKKQASFIRSADNLRTIAEKKLEGINYDKGRTEVSEEDIRKAEELERAEPELAREAQNVYELLRKSVDLLEDSGSIDAATAKQYREYPNYIPLYKEQDFEEAMIDPAKHLQLIISKMGRGANKLPEIKRQKAHFHEVMVESNILKHIAFCTMAAAKNNLNKAAALQMELVGAAEPSKLGKDDPDGVQFRDKGEVKYYTIKDKQALFALQAAQPLINPIFKQLKKVSGVVRGAMVMNPLFWYRQLVREPMTASLVGRTGVVTPFDTLAEIAKIAAGKSKRYEDLKRRGIVAAQDVITDPIEFIKYVEKDKGWVSKGIERVKEIHEAVDGATRAVVAERAYQDAVSKGYSEEDANNLAAIKAREIINFSKQGRSQNVRVMRATTPFFGAALNGLDVLAKAAMPRKYGRLSKAEAMEARRMFYSRAAMIALYTTAYAMASSDNEDYLSAVDRADNWLIPTGNKDNPFAKIAIPYELGFFLKTLPELITLMNMGAISTKKAVTEAGKSVWNTVVPPMPTIYAIKPLVEAYINYDFHTQSPIETGSDSRGMSYLKNKKAGELTKAVAEKLHDAGIDLATLSPDRMEQVLNGYFGQIWAMTRTASDYALYDGPEKPEKILSDYPLLSGALTKGARDAAINDFYSVYGEVRALSESVSKAEKTGDIQLLEKLRGDKNYAKYMKADTPFGDKMQAMDNKQQIIARIEKDPTIDAAEKKRRIDIQNEQRNTLAKQGLDIARKLGLEF